MTLRILGAVMTGLLFVNAGLPTLPMPDEVRAFTTFGIGVAIAMLSSFVAPVQAALRGVLGQSPPDEP